jgi:2,4-dienoyl-CoA reductase-like NADH-dependent reductase (Old Yellow Enzyme family)
MNIGSLEIKNRFVRSATSEGMAHEGEITEGHLKLYKDLAEGGVGLIISGYAYVHKTGITYKEMTGISDDKFISGLRKITDIVHNYGDGCKIISQIAHCGRQSQFLPITLAPSAVLEGFMKKLPKKMNINEIEEIIEAFAQAIGRTKEAGFDGVQLHGAHGYLISQFLSPYTNKRKDEYGGSLDQRIKFVEDIYNRSIDLVGKDFPILIKMNGSDFLEGGITLKESKKIAQKLEKLGFAALEISGCMWEVCKRSRKELGWNPHFIPESRILIGTKNEPAYNLPFAKEIKEVVDIPIIVVGGINSRQLAEKILNEKNADFISLSRPLIRTPDLPKRWIKGEGDGKVECEYCNGCLTSLMTTGLRCTKKYPDESK